MSTALLLLVIFASGVLAWLLGLVIVLALAARAVAAGWRAARLRVSRSS
ncbi:MULTISPECIES: hypothetical protein [unclassified Streptomyces]|nr:MULTISPECIES: hypothetical protein [unclassified Streptomyces]MCY0921871.1 hypothetical protein [Streptomyces sp. H27-G5]MCY0957180.1 hypothetical protein [Streptomyces sp. H27-H5]